MNEIMHNAASKVPQVTLGFWIIKIAATTLGETGGDWVTMSLDWGYALGCALFFAIFVGAVAVQVSLRSYRPWVYWAVIVATTTLGTTLADFADRSLGIGYAGGASILFLLLIGSLAVWYRVGGSVAVETVTSPKVERFYWVTILFSQTLGTALGDWMAGADGGLGLGYELAALVFAGGLAIVAGAYFWTNVSRTLLFWSAFVLTRPLGATLGDLLDKPVSDGGLQLSRFYASAILLVFMVVSIAVVGRRPATRPA